MHRRPFAVLSALSLIVVVASASRTTAAPPPSDPDDRYDVYEGEVTVAQLERIVALGVDRHELDVSALPRQGGSKANAQVEVILSTEQADDLRAEGLDLELKTVEGDSRSPSAPTALQASGYEVWQTYSGPGGIKEQVEQAAAQHPRHRQARDHRDSVNGTDIQALKVTSNARHVPDGQRPAVLYFSAQHAREWITPEMTTRLLRARARRLRHRPRDAPAWSTRNELWFVPVANPDGYDFTFEPGQRLWRKNLRDNDGDGAIAPGDGVDLNRNFPYKWGYDNEGSSPTPRARPTAARSRLRARDAGARSRWSPGSAPSSSSTTTRPPSCCSTASGGRWPRRRPTTSIYEAMAGDDETPAIPGYDPDISAELYTTNGDTDTHLRSCTARSASHPRCRTCEAASDADPDDEWEADDCGSGFEFPDDEGLVQAEFEKNIPFALSVAARRRTPTTRSPSSVARPPTSASTPSTSPTASPQTGGRHGQARAAQHAACATGSTAGRSARPLRSSGTGGERYGHENDDYYAEFRGEVRGAAPGGEVEVWFTGVERGAGPGGRVEHFTYEVAAGTGPTCS